MYTSLMTKPERGSLDWYRDPCQMHWSNGLLSMLSDDLICTLFGFLANLHRSLRTGLISSLYAHVTTPSDKNHYTACKY